MSDYLESTNDEVFDDEEEVLEDEDEETESNLDDGLPSDKLSEYQGKVLTKEEAYSTLYNKTYRTTQQLTKYEKAHIIGVRAQMIADGAPMMVDPGDLKNPIDIARKEFRENKLPMLIRRPLPGKSLKNPDYEIRRVADLQKI